MKTFVPYVALCAFLLAGCAQPSYSQTTTGGEEFSAIVLPALPETLDFAGERVPLDGIPDDFKYLCMAESALNPETVSPAGAAGLWQFMPKTGREYGLAVGPQVDERYDIERSTEAACSYLRDAYEKFGSWTLAAAAYNAGNAGVSRRMNIQGTESYYDTFLPQETMRYLYRILSLKTISGDPERYGYRLSEDDYYAPLDDYRTVEVGGAPIKWAEVAARYGTNYKMLRLLNPWMRDYVYDNKEGRILKVKVPGDAFRSAL